MTPEKHTNADTLRKEIKQVQASLDYIQRNINRLFPNPQKIKFLGMTIKEEEISLKSCPPVFVMELEFLSSCKSEFFDFDTHTTIPHDLLKPLLTEMEKRLIQKLNNLQKEYENL